MNEIRHRIHAAPVVVQSLLKHNGKGIDFNAVKPEPKMFDNPFFCGYIRTFGGYAEYFNAIKSHPIAEKINQFDCNGGSRSVEYRELAESVRAVINRLEVKNEVSDPLEQSELILQIICEMKTGYRTPYEWRKVFWGVESNAFDVQVNADFTQATFTTLWHCPIRIFQLLSKRFPNELIFIQSAKYRADELHTEYTFLGGRIINQSDLRNADECRN